MLKKIKETVEKYHMLSKGDKVLVAVSGGPDSVALLSSLYRLREVYDFELEVYHLNHKLRGKEADNDALFVEQLACSLKLPVTIEEYQVKDFVRENKLSLQEGARQIRYNLLETKAQAIGATKIAIGQNADDQAETILMRFLRGSGIDGLGGIVPNRNGKYIRPLIEVSRAEIEAFLTKEGITARIDASNLKPVYLRNKIRLHLLPLLKAEYNPNLSQIFCQMGEVFRAESEYFDEIVGETIGKISVEMPLRRQGIDKKSFFKLHKALQRRIIKKMWEKISGVKVGINFLNIEGAIEFLKTSTSGSKYNLPLGVWLKNGYGEFTLEPATKETRDEAFNYQLEIPGLTEVSSKGLQVRTEVLEAGMKDFKMDFNNEIVLDYDLLDKALYIRNRLAGDIFSPFKGKGSKKLKDYFIDKKIPRELRGDVLLLADKRHVLWVIGYSINDRFKVTEKTRNIIKIRLDKN